jgi:hypothetical protein
MTRGICLSTVALVMLATPVFAQDKCSAPVAPVVPNGRTAAAADLIQAQKDVVAFIKNSDDYQTCILAELAAAEAGRKATRRLRSGD